MDVRSGVPGSRYGVMVATRDGRFIQTSAMLPHQARALSAVAGIQHTFDDPRFAAQPVFASAEDAQGWEDLLWEAFRSHDLAYWLPGSRPARMSRSRSRGPARKASIIRRSSITGTL